MQKNEGILSKKIKNQNPPNLSGSAEGNGYFFVEITE
jgi:hypothetical protein